MIISASRRCDLPAFSMEWLEQRMRAGFVSVANPFNPKQLKTVNLTPEAVGGIVFWSKNPAPLLDYTTLLAPYPSYIQYTLNPYGRDIEPGVPPFSQRMDTACRIADAFGPYALCPRYDPVLLTEKYTPQWHIERFMEYCAALRGYADTVTVSFLDIYRKIEKAVRTLNIRTPDAEERTTLIRAFAAAAKGHGMRVATCAQPEDYSGLGVVRGSCIDAGRLSRIAGKPVEAPPDPNQRPNCGCAQAVDIGSYGRCAHGCVYCYANK